MKSLYGNGATDDPAGRPLRVALIGTGNISGAHLGYLKTRADVEIAGLCDIRPEVLEKKRAAFGGEGFADYREMLDRVKPDAVWLCTPPQVRVEPLRACAERGVPVFCEKPVERDPEPAAHIASELRQRQAHVQIGYVFRSMPIVQRLRAAMADDRVRLLQSFYACDASLSMGLPKWFYDKTRSGGALVDQATHNLDLLRSLMGEVATIRGVASNPVHPKKDAYTIDETIALAFTFANGSIGSHTHSWVADTWRNEILLSGEKRLYRLDLARGTLTTEEGDEVRTFRQNQAQMFFHENAAFLDMVRSGDWSKNPCDFNDGLATLRLTLACDDASDVHGDR
ncbi:MAG: Gfo/Idh/MocA family oxidoreductase [Lentisphaerae bacterium]|nr:Gfo/Idh/MocA family oxidoreductase [Lentisphaerota bacterium]